VEFSSTQALLALHGTLEFSGVIGGLECFYLNKKHTRYWAYVMHVRIGSKYNTTREIQYIYSPHFIEPLERDQAVSNEFIYMSC